MLNTTINKIVMILTSKILMVKPNNFRSNEETLVNNFFQENSIEIPNNVLNKIAIKEFNRFVRKLEEHKIEVEVIEGSLEYFFNETQARYIISINPLKEKLFISLAKDKKVPITKLGIAKGKSLCFGSNILPLAHVNDLYHDVISNMMEKKID